MPVLGGVTPTAQAESLWPAVRVAMAGDTADARQALRIGVELHDGHGFADGHYAKPQHLRDRGRIAHVRGLVCGKPPFDLPLQIVEHGEISAGKMHGFPVWSGRARPGNARLASVMT